MSSYQVFGGILRSQLSFPELELSATGDADWALDITDEAAVEHQGAQPLGEEVVDSGVKVRSFTIPGGYRLAYDDTGVFDVADDGRSIRWHRLAGADEDAARLDVLGRVLAFALHASGWLTLHGSAVTLREGALGFLAPKGSGKSTLALALVRQGAALMTDDMVVVRGSRPPVARAGVQSVRLFADSAERLEVTPADSRSGGKVTVTPTQHESERTLRAPLAALYLLESVAPDSPTTPVERVRLEGSAAMLGVLAQTKIGRLLGGAEAPRLFGAVANVVEQVAVYRLRVSRDYSVLSTVAAQLATWHGERRPSTLVPAS